LNPTPEIEYKFRCLLTARDPNHAYVSCEGEKKEKEEEGQIENARTHFAQKQRRKRKGKNRDF
jgi:hypothetical protein